MPKPALRRPFRIEDTADRDERVLVLGVTDGAEELFVARWTAYIIGWSGTLHGNTERVEPLCVGFLNMAYFDPMAPAITEVVLMEEFSHGAAEGFLLPTTKTVEDFEAVLPWHVKLALRRTA